MQFIVKTQAPFYDVNYPKSLNFGAIGVVSLYFKNLKNFELKARIFKEEFRNFKTKEPVSKFN